MGRKRGAKRNAPSIYKKLMSLAKRGKLHRNPFGDVRSARAHQAALLASEGLEPSMMDSPAYLRTTRVASIPGVGELGLGRASFIPDSARMKRASYKLRQRAKSYDPTMAGTLGWGSTRSSGKSRGLPKRLGHRGSFQKLMEVNARLRQLESDLLETQLYTSAEIAAKLERERASLMATKGKKGRRGGRRGRPAKKKGICHKAGLGMIYCRKNAKHKGRGRPVLPKNRAKHCKRGAKLMAKCRNRVRSRKNFFTNILSEQRKAEVKAGLKKGIPVGIGLLAAIGIPAALERNNILVPDSALKKAASLAVGLASGVAVGVLLQKIGQKGVPLISGGSDTVVAASAGSALGVVLKGLVQFLGIDLLAKAESGNFVPALSASAKGKGFLPSILLASNSSQAVGLPLHGGLSDQLDPSLSPGDTDGMMLNMDDAGGDFMSDHYAVGMSDQFAPSSFIG